jgi:hypothetical protein
MVNDQIQNNIICMSYVCRLPTTAEENEFWNGDRVSVNVV